MDQIPKNLVGEELGQPGVVDVGDLMEHPGLVHSALCDQEMEVGVEIYPGSEGLDGCDHSGHGICVEVFQFMDKEFGAGLAGTSITSSSRLSRRDRLLISLIRKFSWPPRPPLNILHDSLFDR